MNNIFKELREKHTPKNNWDEPMTQSALAKEMRLHQQTVDRVENGNLPSYKTVKAYHDFFHVPYECFFNTKGIAVEKPNIPISQELHLSDTAINNIRNLSPQSLELLEVLLSDDSIDLQLSQLFSFLQGIDNYLDGKPKRKLNTNYTMTKYLMSETFVDYMVDIIMPKLSSVFKKM